MSLAVLGTGLVSPVGLTARDHAFFIRAREPAPGPSPFVRSDLRSLDVRLCPWLGARLPVADRLVSMAEMAIAEALAPLPSDVRPAIYLCTARPRPGLTEEDRAHLARAVLARVRAPTSTPVWEASGAFEAIQLAEETFREGRADIAVVVAADTWISIAALAELVEHPPGPWAMEPSCPSEAAAAFVLMSPTEARRRALTPLGVVHAAHVAAGLANDDNDEPADGAAMSRALRAIAPDAPVRAAFGQGSVDDLRAAEWRLAVARSVRSFDPWCQFLCPEEDMGVVGAAAGAVNLVYALAALRHRTVRLAEPEAPFLVWAISRDGMRGLARCSVVNP